MTTTRAVRFPGAQGGQLAARLELPDTEPRAAALFAHCFTCSKDLKSVVRISRELAEQGIAVFRFDFTGLGESEGDFADTDFSSNLEDLVGAADYVSSEIGGPEILIGHSLGGAAVLAAADRIPQAKAVATLGAPSDTGHLESTLREAAPELESEEEAEVTLAGRSFRIRRQLLDDLAEHRLLDSVRSLDRPLLLFHSPVDQIVGIDHAARLYEAARHPKSFVSLDNADHLLLSDPAHAELVARVLAAWSTYYAGAEEDSEASSEPEHGSVVVSAGPSGYRQRIQAGKHALVADEPASVGGSDEGPSPYELLLAALGACKSMTMRMYAERKEWPLEEIRVALEHDRIHAEDCAECETEKGKIDEIRVEIGLEGELDDDQRERLLEMADRCPVHRTLTTETRIVSEPGES